MTPSLGPVLGAVDFRSEEFIVPELSELFEWPALPFTEDWAIAGFSLALNRVALLALLAALFTVLFFFFAFRRPQVVPGRLQASAESLVGFVREQIAIETIGKDGVAFVPFLTALFTFIFFCNVFEIIPLINFPVSSRMAIPAFLTALVWFIYVWVGIRQQGPLRYFKDVLFPPGVPKALYILVTPIEIISTFVVRPLTLAIRLFANLLAGHIILTVIFIAIHAFFLVASPLMVIGFVGLVFAPILVAFELLVSVLQAYIFTILAAVYIGGSVNPQH